MPPDPIVIIPGFLLTPGRYKEMSAALRLLGIPEVRVVPVTHMDWAKSVLASGWARILAKVQRTVVRALESSGAEMVVLVGHSSGGMIGRLFLAPEPFLGRVCDGRRRVRGLITLGSPNHAKRASPMRRRIQTRYPGAYFAPEVTYLSVAGKAVRGDRDGSPRERAAYLGYRALWGYGAVWGDGAVPVGSALLEGSRPLVLDGVRHFSRSRRPWYGSADIVEKWWSAWIGGHGWRD